MTTGISLKIDVTKLDKSKFFKGQKGTYVDLTLFLTEDEDKYGNHGGIKQSETKEQKDNNEQNPYVGNAKIFWRDEQQSYQQPDNNQQEQKQPVPDDDIPF